MSEHKLQSQCVLHFSQTYPERRGDLWATFQETNSAVQGSQMLSKGLIPGAPDLIYTDKEKHLIGIEMKYPNTYHNTIHVLEQCRFLIENAYMGWFCVSLNQFEEIISEDGKAGGIFPEDVVDMCIEKIESKIKLTGSESIDDLIFECNKYYNKHKKHVPNVKF